MKYRGPVTVGRFGKPFGYKGEIKLISEIPEFRNFRTLRVQLPKLGYKKLEVEYFKPTGGHTLIIKFVGIDSEELAEQLKGLELLVDAEELPPTQEGEFYFFELINAEVYDEHGSLIGKLEYIETTPAHEVFVIRTYEGRELMVPVVKEFVVNIDKDKGKIVVRLPNE